MADQRQTNPWVAFEAGRAVADPIRAGVWDRICVPGEDRMGGQSSEFTRGTLCQMVENFGRRGDVVPMDHNHQSNYAAKNGQPAPALAYYAALAAVFGGEIVAEAAARGVTPAGREGLDLARDGLWAYRSEVTPLGQELLPNYRYL